MELLPTYDVIVVGAGHAGCEAAAAAGNMGSKVLLITMDMNKIAQMSCNPAVGGIAKGQIVREIDALGGQMGLITDKTLIQFRMLNQSKGPAMWSPRAQSDRMQFSMEWRRVLEQIPNVDFWQGAVTSLIIENDSVKGVETDLGISFFSKTVILTNGTFLNGKIHVGQNQLTGGRISEPPSTGISEQLANYNFEVGRMKTGTPARLDARSIDFSKLEEQQGDDAECKFSYMPHSKSVLKQRPCFIGRTNFTVHETLRTGFEESPLFNGTIDGVGPRYCPSIEDKVVTFASKDSHQLFLEPEGEDTVEYYINGFSSSLPWEVQLRALREVPGLENVRIFRPGYAIEYDFFQPTQLHHTLETKYVENLYFAGQINGTTGYEEAAAQGMIAAINASLKTQGKGEFVLDRDEAYIGVLIDDLVSKGVDEPYRMFTSRAEYRILLRQDNADFRLTKKGREIGLVKDDRHELYQKKKEAVEAFVKLLQKQSVEPDAINPLLGEKKSSLLKQKTKLDKVLLRPEISLEELYPFVKGAEEIVSKDDIRFTEIIKSAEVKVKYQGYVDRERELADKAKRLQGLRIPDNFDFNKLTSLSTEARQKLSKQRPSSLAQASRISGVSPSDINVLLVYFGR